MPRILLIETSAALTSVALVGDGKLLFYKEASHNQASLTAPFIKEALDFAGISAKELDAVCVSMGPGSYTGLRVGVSSAKGLCFGAGVPLLAVGTLDVLVWEAIGQMEPSSGKDSGLYRIIPLIDARRMEVYTAEFTPDGRRVTDVHSQIVEAGTFDDVLSCGQVLFVGDAADKIASVVKHPNASFLQVSPSARAMARPAVAEYEAGNFWDIAYFEPFYLKDFVATVSRKKLF